MAFRIQDTVSSLFWKISGERIVLAETGDDFTEGPDGLVNVFTAGNYVYALPRPSEWKFTSDGFLTFDGTHFISTDVSEKCPVLSTAPTAWVKVGGAEPVAVPEPVAEEEDEDVPELVDDEEDVPVARGSALIEEALNAAAEEDPDIDEEDDA
jgi:hypothetical protein